jgi:hypothetical protein
MRSGTIFSSWALWGLVYVCFRFLAWSSRVACTSNCEGCVPLTCELSVHIPPPRLYKQTVDVQLGFSLKWILIMWSCLFRHRSQYIHANASEKFTLSWPRKQWCEMIGVSQYKVKFEPHSWLLQYFILWRDLKIFIYWVHYDVTLCSGQIWIWQDEETNHLHLPLANSILSHLIITVYPYPANVENKVSS